jgi:hypothetical protein
MDEEYQEEQAYYTDPNTRLRDVEEKQRLLKDRIILVGQNLIEEKETNFNEIQSLKKSLLNLKEENLKMKELLQKVLEQISEFARKEELMILQRQFDIIKPHME